MQSRAHDQTHLVESTAGACQYLPLPSDAGWKMEEWEQMDEQWRIGENRNKGEREKGRNKWQYNEGQWFGWDDGHGGIRDGQMKHRVVKLLLFVPRQTTHPPSECVSVVMCEGGLGPRMEWKRISLCKLQQRLILCRQEFQYSSPNLRYAPPLLAEPRWTHLDASGVKAACTATTRVHCLHMQNVLPGATLCGLINLCRVL